jgi:hypothetical protein
MARSRFVGLCGERPVGRAARRGDQRSEPVDATERERDPGGQPAGRARAPLVGSRWGLDGLRGRPPAVLGGARESLRRVLHRGRLWLLRPGRGWPGLRRRDRRGDVEGARGDRGRAARERLPLAAPVRRVGLPATVRSGALRSVVGVGRAARRSCRRCRSTRTWARSRAGLLVSRSWLTDQESRQVSG